MPTSRPPKLDRLGIPPLGSRSRDNLGLNQASPGTLTCQSLLERHTRSHRSTCFQEGTSCDAQCAHRSDPQLEPLAHRC